MAIASSGAVSVGNAAGSGRSINLELSRTQNQANTSMTAAVTAAITGSTPRGSGTVTQAQPHAFSEWHSYAHATPIGITSYGVRFAQANQYGVWPTGGWGLAEEATTIAPGPDGPDSSEADGGIYLFTIDVGGVTLLKADLIANGYPLDGIDPGEGRYYTTGGSSSGTTFGSYSTNGPPGNQAPNNNAVTIATFDEAGVTVTATRNAVYESHEGKNVPTGMTDNATYGTAVLVANSNAGAPFVDCEGAGCSAEEDAVWRLRLVATKSGFSDTAVDGGLTNGELTIYGSHNAYSDNQD